MPFVTVSGLPDNLSPDFLMDMRRQIIQAVVREMEVEISWVRVFFPVDMLSQPQKPEDGCQTVYVTLETAMFHNKEDVELKKIALATVNAIAHVIWEYLQGKCEVEAFVLNLSPDLKKVLPAIK